jgi:hypothetical protein
MWKRACVGAGLLAKTVCQSKYLLTDTPLSRASPLPLGLCVGYLHSCATNSNRDGVSVDANGLRSYKNTLVPSWVL